MGVTGAEVANILSWKKMSDALELESDQDKQVFIATLSNGQKMYFKCVDGGLYVCDSNNKYKTAMHVKTILENKRDCTDRKVKAAEEARRLLRILAYPSDSSLVKRSKAVHFSTT